MSVENSERVIVQVEGLKKDHPLIPRIQSTIFWFSLAFGGIISLYLFFCLLFSYLTINCPDSLTMFLFFAISNLSLFISSVLGITMKITKTDHFSFTAFVGFGAISVIANIGLMVVLASRGALHINKCYLRTNLMENTILIAVLEICFQVQITLLAYKIKQIRSANLKYWTL